MATLFRPTWTKYVDASGERVSKGTPGAVRKSVRSKVWWGEFRDADNILRRMSLKTTNKDAASQILAAERRKAADQRAGLTSRYEEHAKRPLTKHIDDWRTAIEARGRSAKHVHKLETYVRKVAAACRWRWLKDLATTEAENHLAERRAAPDDLLSIASSNDTVAALKNFGNWLVKARPQRWPLNPFMGMAKLNADTDQRLTRRAASVDELRQLLTATEASPRVFRGLNGLARSILYRVAAQTGLRASELRSLTVGSLQLDGEFPAINLEACHSKRRRDDVQPLLSELATTLVAWLELREDACDANAILWPGSWNERAAPMLRSDLEHARKLWIADATSEADREQRERSEFLRFDNQQWERLDFHALRVTFGTNLAEAGVMPKAAQQLMRHSDINLTMKRYTRLGLQNIAGDLSRLPSLDQPKKSDEENRQILAPTGTTDTADLLVVPLVVPSGKTGETGRKDEAILPLLKVAKNAVTPSSARGYSKAADQIRTDDLRFTKASLCQLSYSGGWGE